MIDALCTMIPQDQVIVVAPTGRASNNIGGSTYHSYFAIYPESNKMAPVTGNSLELLQTRLGGRHFLFLDEASMLDPVDLLAIHSRCQQGTGILDKPFGGLAVILFGDYRQLEPIGGVPLSNAGTLSEKPDVHLGLLLFEQFTKVITLTEVKRQSDVTQQRFREVLSRIRACKCIESDFDFLKDRIRGIAENTDEILNSGDYLYLVPRRALALVHNSEMLDKLVQSGDRPRKCKLIAQHNCDAARNKSEKSYCGLEAEVTVSVGAKIMMNNNLWTEQGLMNGAFGVIRHIIFPNNVGPPNLPDALIIEMDEPYSGPCLPGLPRHVVIPPLTIKATTGNSVHTRTQFPLSLAWSITTYKSQGMYNSILKLSYFKLIINKTK